MNMYILDILKFTNHKIKYSTIKITIFLLIDHNHVEAPMTGLDDIHTSGVMLHDMPNTRIENIEWFDWRVRLMCRELKKNY
jgi:hypothetical protein